MVNVRVGAGRLDSRLDFNGDGSCSGRGEQILKNVSLSVGDNYLLFGVISAAYERNSLIVTTELPFENWNEVLNGARLTGATLDRLTYRCHILEASGERYRLRDAKRRKRPVVSSHDVTKTR